MASGTTPRLFVFVLFSLVPYLNSSVRGDPDIPCYFIFGDSLVDGGNNNYLSTTARVDYLPYGIDFPYGPTGRFCDGRTVADITGQLLGFDDFIPPFLQTSGSEILKGVNYASGLAGIRNETGKFLAVNIDLHRQLQYHQVTISRIVELLESNDSAVDHLNKCLYLFVIGSNDYINNYFLPQIYNTSRRYTPQQYAEVLIEEYSQKIMTLYNFGARMVALTGIPPIGCTPSAIATYGTGGSLCVDYMNDAANLFNDRLRSLVHQLNNDLNDVKLIYLNTYGGFFSQYFSSPGLGIKITSCCGVDEYGLCIPDEAPCQHRELRLFWDAFHPTEAANQIAARTSFLALKEILLG